MSIRDRIAGAWNALTGKSVPDNMPVLRSMVHSGWDGQYSSALSAYDLIYPQRVDHAQHAGDMSQNAAVAACLRVLEDNFPQAELRVQGKAKTVGRTRDSESVRVDHPLALLNNRPNPAYDRYTFWGAMVKSAVCDGNAYAIKIRSRAGIPVELWWVAPWMMWPRWDPNGKEWVGWYAYQVNGREFAIDPKDVIHWRYGTPDPRNERVAISKLKSAAARVVCSLNEVDAFTAMILINGGVPNVAIRPTKPDLPPPNKDQADRMRFDWRDLTQGSRRGEPFIPGGPFEVVPIGFTPEQLALDKIPARLEDQICALTGVNAMVAQLTSGAQHKTYANMAESRRALYEDTLIPMQARLAECLEHQLLGDPGMGDPEKEEIVFSYEGIACLQEDQDARWVRVGNAYKAGVITRATAKGMLSLDFDDDDEVYVDVGTIPADPEEAAEQARVNAQERDQRKPGEGNEELTEEEEEDDESERRPAADKTLDAVRDLIPRLKAELARHERRRRRHAG